MTTRRELVFGAACLAAAAGANALRPRHNVSLLGKAALADIVPAAFGDWRSEDVNDPVAINGPDSLTAKLYNQLLTRVYVNKTTSAQVMMLLAYGGRQTDELQLHRPEICYPAFGYALVRNEPTVLTVGGGVTLPARRLIAVQDDRRESIIYWSRIGEFLPASASEQRSDRFRIALRGVIPDGLLSRFSTVAADPTQAWREIEMFLPDLLFAVKPEYRKVLVGTERGNHLGAVRT